MNKTYLRWDNVWLWGIFFFILLVGVNGLLFYSYQQAAPVENPWIQFWNYCGTDAFKAVTISLVVPIVLAIISGIFKIGNAVEERVRGAQERRIEAQQKCIEQTSAIWNKLDDLTSKVRHFQKNGARDRESITEIILKLEHLLSELGNIVSMWLAKFQNLTSEDMESFLKFMNTLYNASTSVAYYILHGKEENIPDLQSSLGVIKDSIDYIASENILRVLNYFMELSRGDLSVDRKKELKHEIDKRLKGLEKFANEIKRAEEENDILPAVKGEEAEAFRVAFKKAVEWKHEADNHDKSMQDYPGRCDFRKSFSKIPREALFNEWEIDYSMKCLEELADRLGFEYMCHEVEERAEY